ncbi:MAG TPA: hypothetical protein VJB14_16140 [Planctomycetota bacterium]|nr:hypothetical protein [Planctomycetota bacterium]
MLIRFGGAALLLALACLPAVATGGVLSAEDECQFTFKLENPARMEVYCDGRDWRGVCGSDFGHHHVEVATNTCTKVCWYFTKFRRQESDCDGKKLGSDGYRGQVFFDEIDSEICMDFEDYLYTVPGHASYGSPSWSPNGLNVGELGTCAGATDLEVYSGSRIIESHNGGYTIHTRMMGKGASELADDAGCYVGTLRVKVHKEHSEDCDNVTGTLAAWNHGT